MLPWLNIKCNVDWNICERKPSRQIWYNMRIRTHDRGWCHDLIWGDIVKGTDEMGWCLDQIHIAIFYSKGY
jgi:hypothetical protein